MTEEYLNNILKEYVDWLTERKIDSNSTLTLDNLYLFYLSSYKMSEYLKGYENNMGIADVEKSDDDYFEFSKMGFFEKMKIAKDFFKRFNINVDVDECLNDGTINPTYTSFKPKDIGKYLCAHGQCIDGKGDVLFPNSGLALDSVIINHELGHYANKPNGDDFVNLLSEGAALYTELQTYDYLNELGYDYEVEFFKSIRFKSIYDDAKTCFNAIPLVITYVTFGKVTKENFDILFKDKDYYEMIKRVKNSDDFYEIERKMQYIFGMFLAIYMYERVKEDFSFTENINSFNNNLVNSTFKESLEKLGLSGTNEEMITKLTYALENHYNKDIKGKTI